MNAFQIFSSNISHTWITIIINIYPSSHAEAKHWRIYEGGKWALDDLNILGGQTITLTQVNKHLASFTRARCPYSNI